jgi:serine/threonine-protein kinase SRK2
MVYLARNRVTGDDVVIKLIERGPAITRHVANELVIHRKCTGHPLITQLIEVFLTPRHLAIVMEYVPGGDLMELITARGCLPEDEARWLFQQLVVGIAYLHSVGVNNREMKLSNKLLAPGKDEARPVLKIHDFLYK